jgi:hypothetical protein
MRSVIFKGIYYHVQIQGVDRDRVAEYRTKLDVSACDLDMIMLMMVSRMVLHIVVIRVLHDAELY